MIAERPEATGAAVGRGETVAVVPAYNAAASVGATVRALLDDSRVARVVVVDDGSSDATADEARAVGDRVIVVRHAVNGGKGAAMVTGAAAAPDADTLVFVDADLGSTAGSVVDLVESARPDALVVGVPVSADGRGGFGIVRDLASSGIESAVGVRPRSALSGQRVIPRELFDQITIAHRFGVETAMTIDAVRLGYTLIEVDIAADHHHRGKTAAGFAHRAGQGVDIVRALIPRLGWRRTASVVLGTVITKLRRS